LFIPVKRIMLLWSVGDITTYGNHRLKAMIVVQKNEHMLNIVVIKLCVIHPGSFPWWHAKVVIGIESLSSDPMKRIAPVKYPMDINKSAIVRQTKNVIDFLSVSLFFHLRAKVRKITHAPIIDNTDVVMVIPISTSVILLINSPVIFVALPTHPLYIMILI